MSFLASRSQALPARPQSLYFAYGSNLHLTQMAKRCPNSQFQGRAILHRFRWQINDRGFANVVPDPNSSVEGLCYLLSIEDEAQLDRSEGVPTAYQKKWTEVEFFPAAVKLVGRKVTEILSFDLMGRESKQSGTQSREPRPGFGNAAPMYEDQSLNPSPLERQITEISYYRDGGRTLAVEQTTRPSRRGHSVPPGIRGQPETRPPSNLAGPDHGEFTRALVYLSQNHVKAGLPWDEYVERMNWGIIDAEDLGISRGYVEKSIAPFLEEATGFHKNGETRGRGVREKQKRSKNVVQRKHRRNQDNGAASDQSRDQAMQPEPMTWETTEHTHYEAYQGS